MANETLLVLSGNGLPPYAARGISQTFAPIQDATHLERDVNGGLVDLSPSQFRKYASKITCTDQDAPALTGVWPGAVLTVDCITELAYLTAGGSPERTVVPDSVRVDGDYTFYRPRLTMMVLTFNVSTDEYGASVGWELDLEES